MLRVITIFLLSVVVRLAADEKSQQLEFRIRARVQDVVPLPSFPGSFTPIDPDPHYVVTLQIESAPTSLTNFAAGSAVRLAIHSPLLFFRAPDAKGKTYDFLLRREANDRRSGALHWEIRQ